MNSTQEQLLPILPEGWIATPVRYISTCLDRRRVPLNAEQRTNKKGNFPYWGANGIVDYIDDFLFDEPLVLLGEDGAPFFDKTKPVSFYVTGKIWVNNHIHVLRIKPELDPRFIVHALNVTDFGPWIEGSTRDKLTQNKMGSILIPIPPLSIQHVIADYLDQEMYRVNSLIAAKEQLLELLAEKRQAVISNAVTHGLDPNVSMRDSHIPWLGKIPTHWEVERARWLFCERNVRSETGEEELLTVSHITGVTPRTEKDVNMFEAETKEGYKICLPGDLVINTLWAWMGAMGVAPLKGIVSPSYHVYIIGTRYNPSYVDSLVRLPIFTQEIIRYSKGVWTSRLRLYPEGFFEIYLPVPPLDEQQAIIEYISCKTSKINALHDATEKTIALLKERRIALIAAIVTGQIEVVGTA